ncbi:hypothetical protein RclHR1_00460012 [Rhizophagus clarus]|uniref:Uncharacterized protein n=1 Tax=Rhizophagus clarus TaxID=94130 RepID=A0A2Z6RJF1_9GLOM|nr:hypothetical protein RclHR1_00460012 [Rhizophagus clarus]
MEVNLCFVMVCTSSMGPYIDGVNNSIGEIVDFMVNMKPPIKIRTGFCGYSDHSDNSTPTDVLGGLSASVTRVT